MTQSQKVYEYVMNKITLGEWKSGDKIYSENVLAQELDVSRIAVRESYEKLSGMGLLLKVKGSGTYVTEINLDEFMKKLVLCISINSNDLMNILNFRLNFETSNMNDFIDNHSENDVRKLHELYEKMLDNVDNESFYEYDFDFHKVIAEGTGNPVIVSVNNFLNNMLLKAQETIHENVGSHIGVKYHKLILEAIIAKDKELATLLMKRHIEATIDKIVKGKEYK